MCVHFPQGGVDRLWAFTDKSPCVWMKRTCVLCPFRRDHVLAQNLKAWERVPKFSSKDAIVITEEGRVSDTL